MRDTSSEKHYTVKELAALWGKHPQTIIRQARREAEGILRFGDKKVTMTISESAKQRMYARLCRR